MKTTKSETDYRTIRSRLTRIVVTPSVLLLVMWLGFSAYEVADGFYVREVAVEVKEASIPAVKSLVAIQKERQTTMRAIAGGTPEAGALDAQRRETDQAVAALRGKLGSLSASGQTPVAVKNQVAVLQGLLAQLPSERAVVQTGGPGAKEEIYRYYNRLLDAGTSLFDTQARIVPDAEAGQAGLTATEIFRSADQMSRAASLGGGALVAGRFPPGEYLEFAHLVGMYHGRLATVTPFASAGAQAQYHQLTASAAWQRVSGYENALIERGSASGASVPVSEQDWRVATDQVANQLVGLAAAQATDGAELGLTNGNARFTAVLTGSLVALLAVLVGILLARANSRKLVDRALVTRLVALRNATLHHAHEVLPAITSKAKRGEHVDVDAEVPQLDFGHDEIGDVADAFNIAQGAAVAAAVQESQAREGVKRVFSGIAHHNQALTYRVLKILDEAERAEKDPKRLATLLDIDNLTTRQRRHAENLSILAGGKPGRQYRNPVPLADVLQSAAGEIEQYARIHVSPVPDVAVKGQAVTDTIHVIAELMDNATKFSPPRHQVEVRSNGAGDGVLVEIEDHGLGMSDADLSRLNDMLADPLDFAALTLRGDPRLGLFVVARLAQQRGLSVTLHASADGGTRAALHLPQTIIVAGASTKGTVPNGVRTSAAAAADSLPLRGNAGRQSQEDNQLDRDDAASASTDHTRDFPAIDPESGLPQRRRGAHLVRQLHQRRMPRADELQSDQQSPKPPSTSVFAFYRGARKAQDDQTGSPNQEG